MEYPKTESSQEHHPLKTFPYFMIVRIAVATALLILLVYYLRWANRQNYSDDIKLPYLMGIGVVIFLSIFFVLLAKNIFYPAMMIFVTASFFGSMVFSHLSLWGASAIASGLFVLIVILINIIRRARGRTNPNEDDDLFDDKKAFHPAFTRDVSSILVMPLLMIGFGIIFLATYLPDPRNNAYYGTVGIVLLLTGIPLSILLWIKHKK